MTLPQSNYHNLFLQIEPLLSSETRLNEFEAAKLKREINKVPDFGERELLLALFYTVQSDEQKAIDTFDNLIFCGYDDHIVYMNYVSALEMFNMPLSAINKAAECSSTDSDYLSMLLALQTKLLDVTAATETLNIYKAQFSNCVSEKIALHLDSINVFTEFVEKNDGLSYELLKNIGMLAVKQIESERVDWSGIAYSVPPTCNVLSIKYLINSESYTSKEQENLNSSLIDLIIDNDFDGLPITQQFYRASKSITY